jgi:autotransporter-associated beta strand protein
LSGTGGFTKGGAGVLELTGDNSYLGPTTVSGAALRSGAANAIPDGSVVNGNFEVSLVGETIAGLEGTGALDLLGDLVVGVDGADHAYNGPASGGGALVKRGGGVHHLQAASTSHLGQLRVEEGTLNVTGNWGLSATIVDGGATLAGTSNIGPLTVSEGGTLAPGSPGGTGKLTVSGTVTLNGATLAVDLNGTTVISGYDRVSATGLIDLGGSTLHVTVGFTPSTGNAFNIIESVSGFTGTFAGLPDGADFVADGTHFTIDYTGSSVVLTVIP